MNRQEVCDPNGCYEDEELTSLDGAPLDLNGAWEAVAYLCEQE